MAIASLSLAIYFYYNPRRDKNISYTFTEATLIYDASKASPKISLLDSNKMQITDNVYVASFKIWNSGSEPIEPLDVRKPILLKITNSFQILDATIIKEKDVAISEFTLSPVDLGTNKKLYELTGSISTRSKELLFKLFTLRLLITQ